METIVNYPGVQLSWRRVLSIAKNTPDPAAIDEDYKYEDEVNINITHHHTTSRMQSMGRALQNMYTITSQGNKKLRNHSLFFSINTTTITLAS